MMPTEQADRVRELVAELRTGEHVTRLRAAIASFAKRIATMEPGPARDNEEQWQAERIAALALEEQRADALEALTAERDGLQARVGELEGQIAAECEVSGRYGARIVELGEALTPFAEACQHLHPALPDDGVTLDGIEVRHWRQAYALLTPPAPHSDGER